MWNSSRLVGPPVSGTTLVARLDPRMGIFVSSSGLGPPGGVGTWNCTNYSSLHGDFNVYRIIPNKGTPPNRSTP